MSYNLCQCGARKDRSSRRCQSCHIARVRAMWQSSFWDRFWMNVQKGSCWVWTSHVSDSGYGIVIRGRRRYRAHRVAWEQANGPVPDGLELDHLCRNRLCVNPDHLEAVTGRENRRRGVGPSAINARKKRCYKGHPFTPENTIVRPDGSRYCRTCRTYNNQKAQAKRPSRARVAA